jgi:phage terminase small subunit
MSQKRHTQRQIEQGETLLERVPPSPEGMNEFASKVWKKKCQDLKEAGRLTSGILETLFTFCNVLSDMQKARQMMDNSWGEEVFYKYQKAFNDAAKIQLAYARELGFVPTKNVVLKTKKTRITDGLEDLDFDNI